MSSSNIVAVLIVRCTHTGVYADGRPNRGSVTLYDLDEITISKTRTRFVPIPPGATVDIPMSSRTFISWHRGDIGKFTIQGLLRSEIILQLRDKQHCGGPAGTGQALRPGVLNVERVGGTLRFVLPDNIIPTNLNSVGFLAGEPVEITGLTGDFRRLNGSYLISHAAPATGLAGVEVGSYLVEVPSQGPDIPAATLAGVNLCLTEGRVTAQFNSAGDVGGFGDNVIGYVGGQFFPNVGTGGGGAVSVADEGVLVDPSVTLLNFVGAGVTASSAGAGAVDIDIPGGGGAPVDASYVVLGLDPALTDERVLIAGTGLSLTDGGAGGNVTLDVTSTLTEILGNGNETGGTSILVSAGDSIIGATNLELASGLGSWIVLDGLRWPDADGNAGEALVTDGAGTLSFAPVSGAVAVEDEGIPVEATATLFNFTGAGITASSSGPGSVDIDVPGGSPVDASYVVLGLDPTLTDERVLVAGTGLLLLDEGAGGNATLTVTSILSEILGNGNATGGNDLLVSSGDVIVGVADLTLEPGVGNQIVLHGLRWPDADGNAGEVLVTDGAGNLSFAQAAGSVAVEDGGILVESATTLFNFTGTGVTASSSGPGSVDVDIPGGAPIDASYVVLGIDPTLTAERVLIAGAGLSLTDGGVGGNVTLNVTSTLTEVLANGNETGGVNLVVSTGDSIVGETDLVFESGIGDQIVLDGLRWPSSDGNSGEALVTDGTGNLSFAAVAGAVAIEDEGVSVETAATLLNFTGAGVTATSTGPGSVDIDIPGGSGGGAPVGASYVVLALDPTLTDERVLVAGTGLNLTDGGAGGDVTLDVASTLAEVLGNGNETGGTGLVVSTGDSIVGETDLVLSSGPSPGDQVVLDGMRWPEIDGNPGEVLVTDGAGNLSFAAGGAGAVAVEDEGTSVEPAATLFNFTGAGVTAFSAGSGAVDIDIPGGVSFVYEAEADITEGDVVVLNDAGRVLPANATIASGNWNVLGVAQSSVTAGNMVAVIQDDGIDTTVRFGAPPPATDNGELVFLSTVDGEVQVGPPTPAALNAFVIVGTLKGADGVTTTPFIVFRREIVALVSGGASGPGFGPAGFARVNGTTANPSTTSGTFLVIPEMTTPITTQGGRIIVHLAMTFSVLHADEVEIAIFRNGVQMPGTLQVLDYLSTTGSSLTLGRIQGFPTTITDIDEVPAGTYTYDVRWRAVSGAARGRGVLRTLSVLES